MISMTVNRPLRWNIAQEGQKTTVMVHFPKHGAKAIDSSHSNYAAVVKYLTDETKTATAAEQEQHLLELFDIVFTIGKKFESIGDGILTVSGNRIFYDGDEIHSALTDAILKFMGEGKDDWKPLVAFFEKMVINPNQDSVKQLWEWLRRGEFQICNDGDFIGYKKVRDDFLSDHAGAAIVDGVWVEGRIPNKPGSIIEMPRKDVMNDPNNACAAGLHIGTLSFARSFSGSRLVTCKINPRNVVSVPSRENTKLRVHKYVVVEEVGDDGKPVKSTAKKPVDSIVHAKPENAAVSYTNDDGFARYIEFKASDFEKMTTRDMRELNREWKVGTVRTPKAEMVKLFAAEAKKRRRARGR